jgi:chemotaxis protein histidine kinase CheA
MKKMFLATCLLAASVFAAPSAEDVKAATEKPAVEAKTAVTKAKAATTKKKAKAKAKVEKAAEDAKATAAAADAKAQEAAKAAETAKTAATEAKDNAKAAVAEKAPEAEVKAQETAKAVDAAAEAAKADAATAVETKAPAEPIIPAIAPTPEAPKAEPAPVAEVNAPVAPAPVVAPAPAVEVPTEVAPAEVASAEPASTTSRKKKKMIENAVFTVNQIDFDINADFELEAGKVLWTTEDDENSDNFETWSGKANLAILAETQNFKGKVALAFYPGDLKTDSDNHAIGGAEDYFTLDEAWAYQSKDWFSFKVGRWDNTDKNGDYFGGYIDGYKSGFLSTQDPENQFEFGFNVNENMDIALSFISTAAHLNNGDLRLVFNFHDLPSLELFDIQLGYRSNIFDRVHDSKAKIQHNASLKVRAPIVPDFFTVFAEAALMDLADDLAVPVTGGFEFNFKTVDRVILEAEYINHRRRHGFYEVQTKHIKDVLAALYLEKALTDRFSLSAGLHNYYGSRDVMISGNLVGRIN